MKIHYFNGYGRAEHIRMVLAHAKVPFDNVNYNFGEELAQVKASGILEFGQLPTLEVDGKHFSQSLSVLRMVGRQYGYYPSTDVNLAYEIDSIVDSYADLLNSFYMACFFPDEASKPAAIKAFLETTLPKWFAVLEKRLQSNSDHKFIVGDKPTIADFALFSFASFTFLNDLSGMKDGISAVVEGFPMVKAYFVSFGEEQLKEYLAGRPKCPW